MSTRSPRRRARRDAAPPVPPPSERNIPLYELLPQESVEMVHDASMRILEQVGIEFRYAEATAIWSDAGASVDGTRVRIDRELLLGLVRQAPSQFTLHARNPANSIEIGGRHIAMSPNSGSPFFLDRDGSRRYATRADNTACIKAQSPAPHDQHRWRLSLRSHRCANRSPTSGLLRRLDALHRQGQYRLVPRRRPSQRHARDGQDCAWRRLRREQRGNHRIHEWQLAARVGRIHAQRRHCLRPSRTARLLLTICSGGSQARPRALWAASPSSTPKP